MTNYIYRQREGFVTIVERVALPDGITAEQAFEQHRPKYGTDNDLAFSHYADGQAVEIVSVDGDDLNDVTDYAVWYLDDNGNDVGTIDPMFETWYQESLTKEE